MKKNSSALILIILLTSIITTEFNIQPVKANGTIYVRADGSIDPLTAPISTLDMIIYTFTDNIYDEIVVERSNIIVDGKSYTLQGTGSGYGFSWLGINNVTVKNIEIKDFDYGVSLVTSSNNSISGNKITANIRGGVGLNSSSNNIISGNNITNNRGGVRLVSFSNYNSISGNNIITNNGYGVLLRSSFNNSISGNNVTANRLGGVGLDVSSNYNSISGNNITAHNYGGVALGASSNYNSISGNNIANNGWGVALESSSNNEFYYNKFIGNTRQVYDYSWDYPEMLSPSVNVWDDVYPSGGNYWNDYEERYPNASEIDDSSIWDMPYVIDSNNADQYPLMSSYVTSPAPTEEEEAVLPWILGIIAAVTGAAAVAALLWRRRK